MSSNTFAPARIGKSIHARFQSGPIVDHDGALFSVTPTFGRPQALIPA